MRWRQWMRAVWPFGDTIRPVEADAAFEAANRSHKRAVEDRRQATEIRAEADVWAQQIRNHNTANRYDTWLSQVMRGER